FLSKLLKNETVFVDVGANFGYFCVLAAKTIGDKCTIHAFEANPKLAALLKRTFHTFYPHISITVHPLAVASTSGTLAYLNTHGTLMGGSWITKEPLQDASTSRVPTVALDDVLPEKVDFIKIDAEGSERDVWHGMKRTLAHNRDLSIAMEF